MGVKQVLSPPPQLFITDLSKAVVLLCVVLCCLFLVSEFRRRFTLRVFILFFVRFRLLREIPAHSVDHMFFLYF